MARRIVRSAGSRAEALAVLAGVRAHRPRYDIAASSWDSDYASGELDHYDAPHEAVRYAVLVGYIRDRRPRTILDIGCGVGILRRHVDHLDFNKYVGIDPSRAAVDVAAGLGYDRTDFEVATVPTGAHDVIVCNEMLYYVDDLDDLLERIGDCLTPDGRLVTSVYKHPGDFALHRILERRFRAVHAVDVRNRHTPHRWKLASYALR